MLYDEADGFLSRVYDADYGELRTPSGDVDFYVEEARRCGGPVAEFGCGTGRILVPTAEAGIEIAGVDASRTMLDRAREKLAARPGLPASVSEGDMRSFRAGRRFALVTVPFRALSHLVEVEDQVRALANFAEQLDPGGLLVFDVFHPNPAFLVAPREEKLDVERSGDGCTVRRFSKTTPHRARQVTNVTFRWEIESASGGVERQEMEFPMRWYHRFELEHLLARCGFRIDSLHGNFDRSPFVDDSPEMIFRARRIS